MNNHLNLHRLQVFRTIYEMSSVSAAARQLRLSQPTVSRHLAIFEDEIKIKLFRNVGGRLAPTPEAEQLYTDSKSVFEQLLRVKQSVASLQYGSQETLRMMASSDLFTWLLPSSVAQLQSEMPELEIIVEEGGLNTQLEALRRGEIDLAIGGPAPESADLKQETIGMLSLVTLVRKDSPLAYGSSVDLSVFERQKSVLPHHTGPLGLKIADVMLQQGVSPQRSNYSRSIIFSINLAQQLGIPTITYLEAAFHLGGHDMLTLPFKEPLYSPLVVIEAAKQPERRSTSSFKKMLRKVWQTVHLHNLT